MYHAHPARSLAHAETALLPLPHARPVTLMPAKPDLLASTHTTVVLRKDRLLVPTQADLLDDLPDLADGWDA